MSKKLTQSKIKQLHTEVVKQREIKLEIGKEEYVFLYDTSYSTSKIEAIVQELLEYTNYTKENEISDFNVFSGIIMLVLKHMTDIPYKTTGSVKARFESLVQTTAALKDIIDGNEKSVFDTMVSLVVVEGELNKITDKVKLMTENIDKMVETMVGEIDANVQ